MQTASEPKSVFEIPTPNGTLTVTATSQVVRLDGVACWLSYAPIILAGKPCVYSLDAQKTLQPLLKLDALTCPRRPTVVIDPGHGGSDTGSLSAGNLGKEKAFTLDWAVRVRRLLNARGWRVILTRTNDVACSLTDRVALAERAQADLFVSLHFNSGVPNHGLCGIETYCMTPAGLPSNLVHDNSDDTRVAFPNNAYDAANFIWAFRLHRALVSATDSTDRGVRRARFLAVLRWQNRPAVLLEAGYLSNPAEAQTIANAKYRQKLAEAVAKVLEKSLNGET